ncbi:Autophagy-related protein, partial [Lachnellula willkommii]
MEDGEAAQPQRRPRYAGEDVSPTSSQELKGFYAYGVAAEVFAVCGVGSFLPVTLEQLARERGVLWSDKTTSCMAKKAAETGARLLSRAAEKDNNQCVVSVLGAEITTSSFAMYTFSIAVFVQALALEIIAKIASILVIIGVTCLGSSFVILNSFLPLLVANMVPNRDSSVPMDDLPPSYEESSNHTFGAKKSDSSALKLSTKISSKGVGIGYMAAVFVQILSILLLFLMSKTSVSSTLPLRLVLFLVGAWWFAFTIPSSLWLRDRPGPPLKTGISGTSKLRSCLAYISFACVSLWKTIKVALKLRQAVIFLIAWFLLSDAVATVSGTAILFARTELRMGTVAIALLSITVTSSGIAGAFVWPVISRRYALKTNRTIVACIALMEIIPLYGLLGFLPFVKSWGVGGLQKAWEIYPLGFIHGF